MTYLLETPTGYFNRTSELRISHRPHVWLSYARNMNYLGDGWFETQSAITEIKNDLETLALFNV
ncbi:MAG: hypothetical protein J07HQX50_02111 [Haloquadratum sp. J07HQX50]|nr:MAG: hypothetical protein J07HQX50_02111 [Haloquadratum sp. J07HQX50]